jgi:hypothetical protein
MLVATWEFEREPSGMSLKGPDMSPRDMRLVAASDKAAG